MQYRVGIDTGGTFTDIVLMDETAGEIETAKVESTPSDPGLALLRGGLANAKGAVRRRAAAKRRSA
jgi:N-methylhydantoinase A/oxoprolinase/acetone carboxylase beta subunit